LTRLSTLLPPLKEGAWFTSISLLGWIMECQICERREAECVGLWQSVPD
jgi:hypothetical protein